MTSPPRSEFQHLFWRLYAPVTAAAVVIVLTAADRIFVEVGIPYERQIWLFRIAAIVVPAAVFLVTRSVARELRDTGWHPLRGADDRTVRRTGSGGFE